MGARFTFHGAGRQRDGPKLIDSETDGNLKRGGATLSPRQSWGEKMPATASSWARCLLMEPGMILEEYSLGGVTWSHPLRYKE